MVTVVLATLPTQYRTSVQPSRVTHWKTVNTARIKLSKFVIPKFGPIQYSLHTSPRVSSHWKPPPHGLTRSCRHKQIFLQHQSGQLPRVWRGQTVSSVDITSSVHGTHEHLQSNDGVDDDDKEDQESDLDERDEGHHDGVEDHLQAGNSRDQPQRS